MIILAIIGVILSLIVGFLTIVNWDVVGVFIAVSLGIPTLVTQVKAKPKQNNYEQEVKTEEKEILREDTIRVSPTEKFSYEFELTRGDNLKGEISSSSHINIYFVNNTNFKKWDKDRTFTYEYCNESVFETKVDYVVPRKGTWYLLIENKGRKSAKVKVLFYIST